MSTPIHDQITYHLDALGSAKSRVPGNEEEASDLQSTIDMHIGKLRALRKHPDATDTEKGFIDSALQPVAGSRATSFDIAK